MLKNVTRALGYAASPRVLTAWLLLVTGWTATQSAAIDHVLTIGGGYAPEGNQASLEANVLFFQRVIASQHPKPLTHRIQFADGFDPGSDLQIVIKRDADRSPAVAILQEIFAPPSPPGTLPGSQQIGYRNHRVPNISGSNRLNDLRNAMDVLKEQIHSGDRLVVYVTAHGGSADKDGPDHETSITCWGKTDLNMSELSKWLDRLPHDVPVVLVMAQCYCGGFSNTIFAEGNSESGLSKNVRTGFFAQRHDLPAAGCRPDVENDEEYSSYFWGAILGQTRSGKPVLDADVDHSGKVSLAEAHAFAVVASETIDIPLRGSDALLRHVSRIPGYEVEDSRFAEADESEADNADSSAKLVSMSGTVQELISNASIIDRSIVTGLCKRLDLNLASDVAKVFDEYAAASREYRNARRGGFGRRGRGASGYTRRRELQEAIVEKWPELKDEDSRKNASLLQGDSAEQFVKELKEIPGYEAYITSRDERTKVRGTSFNAEMRQVRLRRLIHTLESIVLNQNLKQVATPEMVERYNSTVALESSLFE